MTVTIRDIARHASVSHTTVSLVLNRRPGRSIPTSTRDRVFAAAEELGYRPNQLARALSTGRTRIVEVVGIRPYDPYYIGMLVALQETLAYDGYRVIASPQTQPHRDPADAAAGAWPVDGIIAVDSPDAETAPGGRVAPIVYLGAYVSDAGDSVAVDMEQGMRQAVNHLWRCGKRRIAYVGDSIDSQKDQQREAVYAAALDELGQTPIWINSDNPTRQAGREAIIACYDKVRPDAIICRSDALGIGVFRGLCDLGVSIPGEVALVGCGGTEEASYLSPALSTIAKPTAEMCKLAWTFLTKRMEDASTPRQFAHLDAEFISRGSTELADVTQ